MHTVQSHTGELFVILIFGSSMSELEIACIPKSTLQYDRTTNRLSPIVQA